MKRRGNKRGRNTWERIRFERVSRRKDVKRVRREKAWNKSGKKNRKKESRGKDVRKVERQEKV